VLLLKNFKMVFDEESMAMLSHSEAPAFLLLEVGESGRDRRKSGALLQARRKKEMSRHVAALACCNCSMAPED